MEILNRVYRSENVFILKEKKNKKKIFYMGIIEKQYGRIGGSPKNTLKKKNFRVGSKK